MEQNKTLTSLTNIFSEVLDDDNIILSNESTANDVEEWDSLTNIQIIVAIEKYFKIKFTSQEIQSWKSIGELIACITSK